MKRKLLLNMQALLAAAVVTLSAGVQPVAAQDQITLTKADFTTPAWTKLLQASKAKGGNLP